MFKKLNTLNISMDEVGASALSHIDALYKNLASERKSFHTL